MFSSSSKKNLLNILNHKIGPLTVAKSGWGSIVEISEHSRVVPLLFDKIKDKAQELGVPDDIYDMLKSRYKLNLIRNNLLLEELGALRIALAREAVSCILLKGVFLTNTIFRDNIGARVMADVDILVKEKDIEKTDIVLRGLGYSLPPADIGYIGRLAGSRKAAMYFKYYDNRHALAPVHLHWHIVNISKPFFDSHWFGIDMDAVWKGAERLEADDDTFFVMNPAHAVLALTVHGFGHSFSRLDIIYDIHSYIMLYGERIDWEETVRLAGRWGVTMPLRMGLFLAVRMFCTSIPQAVIDIMNSGKPSMIENLFESYVYSSSKASENMNAILYYAHSKGFRGKINFLKTALNFKLAKKAN
ncbi:MAG: nucleotidyltransferase family protein [Candidatus Omnitrophica bacterium]|nr:nucleotidyltransferase family protein [Candidatus Omnitrophota bacterium]